MNKKKRLEYLRGELRNGSLSYGELSELQSLAPYIEEDDLELLEAAGIPEFSDDEDGQKSDAAESQPVPLKVWPVQAKRRSRKSTESDIQILKTGKRTVI